LIAAQKSTAPAERPDPTVLLVDDDRLILATLSHGLRASGFKTIEAATGVEALQLCMRNPPSVAIIDYDLPGVTGLEIAKSLQPHASFPMIFLSAYGDDKIVSSAIELGVMAYLVKPIDPSRLVPILRTVMQRFAELTALKGESAQLASALHATRSTSMVVGLLMERLRLSEKQAYDRLRQYCRSQNRKVADVATDILAAADGLNSVIANIAGAAPVVAKAK
jgi:response regulator NasT